MRLGGRFPEAAVVGGGETVHAAETRGRGDASDASGAIGEQRVTGMVEADAAQQLHRGLVPVPAADVLHAADAQAHGGGEVYDANGLVVMGLEPGANPPGGAPRRTPGLCDDSEFGGGRVRQSEQDGGEEGLLDAASRHGVESAGRGVFQHGAGVPPCGLGDLRGENGGTVGEEAERAGGRVAEIVLEMVAEPCGAGGDDQAALYGVGSHAHGLVMGQDEAPRSGVRATAVAAPLHAHRRGRRAKREFALRGRGVDDDALTTVADPYQADRFQVQAVDGPVQGNSRVKGL
jgi:hypothetical protein